ncbi:hypothetical protein D3C85_1152300 [compost metagenome]
MHAAGIVQLASDLGPIAVTEKPASRLDALLAAGIGGRHNSSVAAPIRGLAAVGRGLPSVTAFGDVARVLDLVPGTLRGTAVSLVLRAHGSHCANGFLQSSQRSIASQGTRIRRIGQRFFQRFVLRHSNAVEIRRQAYRIRNRQHQFPVFRVRTCLGLLAHDHGQTDCRSLPGLGRIERCGALDLRVREIGQCVVGDMLSDEIGLGLEAARLRGRSEVDLDHPGGHRVFGDISFDLVTPPVHAEADPDGADLPGVLDADGAQIMRVRRLPAACGFRVLEGKLALRQHRPLR